MPGKSGPGLPATIDDRIFRKPRYMWRRGLYSVGPQTFESNQVLTPLSRALFCGKSRSAQVVCLSRTPIHTDRTILRGWIYAGSHALGDELLGLETQSFLKLLSAAPPPSLLPCSIALSAANLVSPASVCQDCMIRRLPYPAPSYA